jgi:hypothetical protein
MLFSMPAFSSALQYEEGQMRASGAKRMPPIVLLYLLQRGILSSGDLSCCHLRI